jgi:putative transposase
MTSPAPLQPGQYYHIYNRGNNRENVFIEKRNYPYFLKLYARHIEPVADTYAYCLLRNHFHFLVRVKTEEEQGAYYDQTPRGSETLGIYPPFKPKNPSQQFGNLFNAYAKAINRAHNRTGSLFEHPFGRILVTCDTYFVRLVTYIHQNPQKHGLVDDFRSWPYSSYRALLSTRPTRLNRDDVLAWFDGVDNFVALHQREIAERHVATLVAEDFD